MSRPLNERNTAIINAYNDGSTMDEIAIRYVISRQRVHQILKARGIPSRPTGPLRPTELDDRMVALYETGGTLRDVAEVVGVSYGTVRNVLRRRGVTLRPPGTPTLIGRT